MVMRQMAEGDIPELVELHLEVFKGYNAAMMGRCYLKSLYHTLARDNSCISIVAVEDGNILGWIGGVGDWLAYEKALILNSMFRVPMILFSILKNRPRLVTKTFSVLRRMLSDYSIGSKSISTEGNKRPNSQPASLLVIGVAPWRQNQGIGQLMMKDFHGRLFTRGFTASAANTFFNNEAGNKAFQKAGYKLLHEDDGINQYIKYLTEEAGD
jgi:ribosomal protein S18 acetylase RimI-like enzyme